MCLIYQARTLMPNPHGDPLLKQPLMKLQPQACDILFGKPGYVCFAIKLVSCDHSIENTIDMSYIVTCQLWSNCQGTVGGIQY